MPLLVQKPSKSVACQKCHVRKVKCSGGQPCISCRDAGLDTECVYPNRDRQVKLSERYLNTLLEELEELRNNSPGVPTPPLAITQPIEASGDATERDDGMKHPLFDERPWFHEVPSSDLPIHIGEAADAAFATRFRQTLATVCTTHLPRTSFIPDSLVRSTRDLYRWPTPTRARFLLKVALTSICRYYHIVRKSKVQESLELAIKSSGQGERLVIAKLLALFALGEAYSARTATHTNEAAFPGLAYFGKATKMIEISVERPQIDVVEISLLLALYSYTLNRRHSAYFFASSAARVSLIIGLHLDIPESHSQNRLATEHRIRLWWTTYVIDRTCASKVGVPASVSDHDIPVRLPSKDHLGHHANDFGDVDYELCSISLSRIAAKSTNEIYSRRHHTEPFSHRVQMILKELNTWLEILPSKFRLRDDGSSSSDRAHIVYLNLNFNQGIILATRPILLHVLERHIKARTNADSDSITAIANTAITLAETCIQCARHSYRIITDAWGGHGTFATFDYFNTQFLFSAATVLAISSLLDLPQNDNDKHSFENAVELLRQLDASGSFAAKEFCEHIDAIQQSMAASLGSAATVPPHIPRVTEEETTRSLAGHGPTASMALADPLFQDFLSNTDLVIQGFDNSLIENTDALYWPDLYGTGEASTVWS